jgi:hypothetical protein
MISSGGFEGSSTIAGTYTSKQAYIDRVYLRLDERLERWPVPRARRSVVDGDWAGDALARC